MPRIFDNIDQQSLLGLRETIELSTRSDFCVGYFNLRGWKEIDSYIEPFSVEVLTSQSAISKSGRGRRRTLPYASAENGAVMAGNILRSERAIQISVVVVCAFVKMRAIMATQKELASKLAALEMARTRRLNLPERASYNITQQIIALPYPPPPQPKPPRKRIGFLMRERAARCGVT